MTDDRRQAGDRYEGGARHESGPRSPQGSPQAVESGASSVADLLHDLGQPLSAIRALAATPLSRETADERDREARERLRQIGELAEWMRQLLGRGSSAVLEREPLGCTDAANVIADVVVSAAASFQGEVRYRHAAPAPVLVDPVELRRAFGNVLDNAMHAAGPHWRVEVRVRRTRSWLRVEVQDDGPGLGRVPPRSRRGLAATQAVLDHCGGVLEIAGQRSGGSLVRLEIPLVRAHVSAIARRT